jgi:putative peptidoglycan lipid II flippase
MNQVTDTADLGNRGLRMIGSSRQYILKNASISATLAGLGAISGLVVDALILNAFGVGSQTDAFFSALTVPLLISTILAIQGPKVLIPVFSEYFRHNDYTTAWDLLRNLLTTAFCALVGMCLLGVTLSAIIVPLQIPGLDPKTIAAAVGLNRIIFWLILCQGLASILGAVLNAQHRYVVAASGKLMANTVSIIVIIFAHNDWGIEAVAAAMLLGSFVQALILALALSTSNFRYYWVLKPSDPKLREILRSFRNPLAGHVLGESGMILHNVLSSFLGSGSLTAIRYASRIIEAIAGVLLGSVVQVTFALMAKHAVENDLRAQRQTLLEAFRILTVVGVPLCIWLILAAEPLVVLLFERGEFSRTDAGLVALLIQMLVPYILLGRVGSVIQALFYANMDMRTPLISTIIYTFANTAFAILLVVLLGIRGLPIAVSLANLSAVIYMIVMLQRRFGPVGWSEMRGFPLRLTATCAMGVVGFAVGAKLIMLTTASYSVTKVLDVMMPTAFGMCLFIVGAFLFRLIDSGLLLSMWRRAS